MTYRWSSRFMFLDAEEAKARLERTRKKWQQKVRPFFDQLFQTQSRSVDQDAMKWSPKPRMRLRSVISARRLRLLHACRGAVRRGQRTPEGEGRGYPPADPGRRVRCPHRDAQRHRRLPWKPSRQLVLQYPRAADQHPQPFRPRSAELRLVGKPKRAMSVLSAGISAADAGRFRLHTLPVEPACRRRRSHAGVRPDGFRQVDPAGADRGTIPPLRKRTDLCLRQGTVDAAADACSRRRSL
jgi:hypothetical protein